MDSAMKRWLARWSISGQRVGKLWKFHATELNERVRRGEAREESEKAFANGGVEHG